MSEDKIEVNMNIYDIPILVEALEKANKEIDRLNNIINELEKMFNHETLIKYYYGMSYEFEINDFKDDVFKIIKGSDK